MSPKATSWAFAGGMGISRQESAAGFKDAWMEVHPFDPGLTCFQAPLANNPISQLYQRIHLIRTLKR
jgi:hypothetical protein